MLLPGYIASLPSVSNNLFCGLMPVPCRCRWGSSCRTPGRCPREAGQRLSKRWPEHRWQWWLRWLRSPDGFGTSWCRPNRRPGSPGQGRHTNTVRVVLWLIHSAIGLHTQANIVRLIHVFALQSLVRVLYQKINMHNYLHTNQFQTTLSHRCCGYLGVACQRTTDDRNRRLGKFNPVDI